MNLISLRLPKSLIKKIDRKAKSNKQNRSEFIRNVLENWVCDDKEIKSDRLTEVRDELLLAVGQLGDSLRQLPKFMKQSEHRSSAKSSTMKTPTKEMSDPGESLKKNTPTTSLKPMKPDPLPKSDSRSELVDESSIKVSEIGWSNMVKSKPELTLRPRQEPELYAAESIDKLPKTPQPSEANISRKSIVTEVQNNAPPTDKKPERRRGQLKGRPIGEERRQSIRLARVLAYKKWDSRRLAERLRMPIEIIEHAIEGRKDLASLKVEALLSTWEEEMQHVGWKPDSVQSRK